MTAATVDDVAVGLGRPITAQSEIDQVSQWLADAEMQIKARLGDVSLLDQTVLAYVEREAALLRQRNPNGYKSETIEDYTYSFGDSTHAVTILDEWWLLLNPDTGSGAFSARPYFVPDTSGDSTTWLP